MSDVDRDTEGYPFIHSPINIYDFGFLQSTHTAEHVLRMS